MKYNFKIKLQILFILFLLAINFVSSQSNSIELKGSVVDIRSVPIPYAAIGIPSKFIGTATTEDGEFQLSLENYHISDTLEISSIGFKTHYITVQEYINLTKKIIVLNDDVSELNEVHLLKPKDYVKNAIKNLKSTTIRKPHQLNILYRRFSVEDGKARFFVEHYLKAVDRGPTSPYFDEINVIHGRKSADYRFVKTKQNRHSAHIMNDLNPLRTRDGFNKYKWKKTGDTTYDGEDVIIIEGTRWKGDYLRLYIGMDNYAVYKVENSNLNSVFIYKKNIDGKLYLSYHNREWKNKRKITPEMQKILGNKKAFVQTAYRHEMFVLGLETDKNKIEYSNNSQIMQDIGDMNVPYMAIFWSNFSIPPATKFFMKSIKEVESIYGVDIETQFRLVNK